MKASENAFDIIRHFEGLKLRSYLCPRGVPTIGYGHTGEDVDHPSCISEERARELLENDVYFFETALNGILKREIPQNHFDAILSWMFNIGVEQAKLSTLMAYYQSCQYERAADEFPRWNKVTQHGRKIVFKGLTNRRQVERTLFLTGLVLLTSS